MKKLLINTERLLLRNLKASDVNDFFIYRSNPEVTKYQGFDIMTKDECITFIDHHVDKLFSMQGEWIQFGIEHKETGKLVGDFAIKLDSHDDRLAEIGLTISHLHQKKGYAKETLVGILAWLFDNHNIHRVTEIVDAENIASLKLLQSIGFREEGHFIENIFFKGKWGSEFQYAILKREWDAIKQNHQEILNHFDSNNHIS